MVGDDSVPGAVLTPSQREFLRGERGEDLSDASKRMTRKRIRERLGVALADFSLLYKNRTEIDLLDAVDVRDDDVMHGLVDAIALLFLVSEQSDLNFERVLYNPDPDAPDGAVQKAARELGQRVEEVRVDTVPADQAQFRERILEGDQDLERSDVLDALQDGVIDQQEFWSWIDQQQRGSLPGRVGQLATDETPLVDPNADRSDWATVVDALEELLVEKETPRLEDLADRVGADPPMVEGILLDDERGIAAEIAGSNLLEVEPTGFNLEKAADSTVEIHPITEE